MCLMECLRRFLDSFSSYRMVRDEYVGDKDYFESLCDTVEVGDKDYFESLCDTVEVGNDLYLLGSDFGSYLEAQAAADKAFVEPEKWIKMSILSAAGSGRFSCDKTIREYAESHTIYLQ